MSSDEARDIQKGDYVRCTHGVCRVLRVWRDVWPWSYEVLDRACRIHYVKPDDIHDVQIKRSRP